MSGLNPQIKSIEVGVREVREAVVYPLSMKDQMALPEVLIDAFGKLAHLDYVETAKNAVKDKVAKEKSGNTQEESADVKTFKIAFELIEKNIDYILEKCTDGVTTEELTNDQFVELVDVIFAVNYEGAAKKVLDLVGRVKSLFNQAKA